MSLARRRFAAFALVLVSLCGVSLVALADFGDSAGVLIPYAGRLEKGGVPLNKRVKLQFSIANSETGSACYSQSKDVEVREGDFSVVIGPVTEACVVGVPVYLDVAVDEVSSGGGLVAFQTRQRIHPSLGAMTSGAGDFMVSGDGALRFEGGGEISGSGNDLHLDADDVVIWSGTGATPTARFTANGNVGVLNNLDVDGDANVDGTLVVESSAGSIRFDGTPYRLGHQNGTLYSRAPNFAWYHGGEHSNTEFDPGLDGEVLMTLKHDSGLSVEEDLNVKGEFTVQGQPGLVGGEALRVVRGVVQADGDIESGSGFTVLHPAAAFYQLNFDPPFGDRPSVVVTQRSSSPTPFTTDNCVVTSATFSASQVTIKCGDGDGNDAARMFSFIAIGAP